MDKPDSAALRIGLMIARMHGEVGMRRDRAYSGQPHTDEGERGKAEVHGITFRDLRDCFIRAVLLSAGHVAPAKYEEATKGELALLSANDMFGFNLDDLNPIAIGHNLACEVERAMGIYPNVPKLVATDTADLLQQCGAEIVDLDEPDPNGGFRS